MNARWCAGSRGPALLEAALRTLAVLLVGCALSLVVAPVAAEAQQAGKVYRVGYLSAGSRESQEPVYQALLQGLIGRGWVEGQESRA